MPCLNFARRGGARTGRDNYGVSISARSIGVGSFGKGGGVGFGYAKGGCTDWVALTGSGAGVSGIVSVGLTSSNGSNGQNKILVVS
jgi:hypothetical protein